MKNNVDLTKLEDLSMAVMNLISIEEHLAFTAMKTKKEEYLQVLDSVRTLRKSLLKKLVKNTEGELWCISKHLLATSMRLMETSTKYINNDNKQALEFAKNAHDLYGLFWFLQKIGEKNVRGIKLKSKEMER